MSVQDEGNRTSLAWEPFALIITIVLAWELAAHRGMIDVLFFPAPSAWLQALRAMAVEGTLAADVAATLRRLLLGVFIGSSLAAATGLLVGRSARAYRTLNPFVAFLHPLPKIAVFPLLLLLLGLGDRPRIAVIAIAAFFPLFVTTVLGVRQLGSGPLEVARSFHAGWLLTLRRVLVPASLPAMASGLRLSFNGGLTSAIALEFVSGGEGLGARIWQSWQSLRTDRLFAVLLLVAGLGFASSLALQWVLRRFAPWAEAA